MKRVLAILLLLVLLLQLTYPTIIVVGREPEYVAFIYVPTVIDEEKGEGGVVKIGLYVTNSSTTDIVVEGPDYVAEDTLYVAKLALLVVEKIVGVKQGYEYHIVVETRGRVAGPSAGAAFAVLLMSAMLGDEIRHDLAMTGALSGDGGVEGVAGLVIKANATKQYGLNELVAPYNVLSPPIYEKIKKLNLTIRSVANVLEAYYEATGRRISASTTPKVPLAVAEEFQKYAYHVIDEVESRLREVVDEAVRAGLEFKIINSTRSFIEDKIKKALQALSEGEFYSAASLAFTAYVNLTSLETFSKLFLGNTSVDEELDNIKTRLRELNSTLTNANYTCLGEFEVIAAAWYRLYDAYETLNAIKEAQTLFEKAKLIAYASARISTAEYWYNLRDLACLVDPIEINETLARKIADYAYSYAKLAYNYVRSIVVETTGSEKEVRGLDSSFQELEKVVKLGIPELTYAYAAELASRIYSPLKVDITLTSLLNRTSVEKVLEAYREAVSLYYERLISKNIKLIMAPAYLEYSRWIGNPYVAAQMIAMADSYLTPILLAYSNVNINLGEISLPARSAPIGLPMSTYYYMIAVMGIGMGLAFLVGVYLGSKIALPKDLEEIRRRVS